MVHINSSDKFGFFVKNMTLNFLDLLGFLANFDTFSSKAARLCSQASFVSFTGKFF